MATRFSNFNLVNKQAGSADSAPPLPLLAREALSFAYMRTSAAFASTVPLDVAGNGRHVMVIPGFMASDQTTSRLRRSLQNAGFAAHGWGLGRNKGIKSDIFERLGRRVEELAIDGPLTLVGWSLGGLIAREYAKSRTSRC